MSVFLSILNDEMRFDRTCNDWVHELTSSDSIFEFKTIGDKIICAEIVGQVLNGDIQRTCDQNNSLVCLLTEINKVFGTGKNSIDEDVIKDLFGQNFDSVF